ncbi:MAG: Nicotinamide-nucleotide amidohydrolase PncC [Phycisphaerae bacterium]|nr:Nicotinamide-nucleotide amidohydrolase PncC [Phycisphaerae bacterium]
MEAIGVDRMRRAAVVAIGDELVSGQTVDTNSAWLSRRLEELGAAVTGHWVVADDAKATADAIAAAARSAGWVVVTGGLGPTPDDLTRQAAADLLGQPLQERPDALEQIQERFRRLNRRMADINRVQALFPASAGVLVNPIGTAPGLRFSVGGAECFCLPGVPREMRMMFDDTVAGVIAAGIGDGRCRLTRTVHTFGIGESDLAERLGDLLARGTNPQVGTTAGGGSVSVRIYALGDTREQARRMLDDAERRVRDGVGEFCFGCDDQTLESVVGELLRRRGQTLALAESCTGGLLGEMITAVPGSSDYFVAGLTAYANAAKVALLGVEESLLAEHGAVSEPVAEAMARNAHARTGADWALSITGIAGPDGGSADKPVGLVFIGLAGPGGASARRYVFPGDRETVRTRAARTALSLLWRALTVEPE